MLIIDSHCHAGHGDLLTHPSDTNAALNNYLKRAYKAGISKTIIFPAFNSNYDAANREVFQIVKKNTNKFWGYVFVHPIKEATAIFRKVKLAVEEYGFKGIKVHKHDGHITREICVAAQYFHLPVLYDVMGDLQHLELVASEYPKVNFIIPHLGSYADEWNVQVSMIDLLCRHPNLYTDTSGIRNFDILQKAVNRAGANKIIFGSDGPWLNPEIEVFKIKALRLQADKEALIFSGNIMRLISTVNYY